ncbi:hypothetical protein [Arsukibacterium sp.]|uniref:hypothetical protein n=1 Tax=Arsukibacterium sp. TaxID=1977258 RepID=UPI00299DC281|nr:hypothetical protein [Arsukibacterium sp.]MDX1538714.1 hypothetical protein [Arsukibacterium sp.]
MRKVVLAFNMLSVVYAIIAGLALAVAFVGVPVALEGYKVSPYLGLYIILPLIYNLLTVYGLKRLKLWGYVMAAIELLLLMLNLLYGWLTGDWQNIVGSIVWVGMLVILGSILYSDFRVRHVSFA